MVLDTLPMRPPTLRGNYDLFYNALVLRVCFLLFEGQF
jgi:hypothetical protein